MLKRFQNTSGFDTVQGDIDIVRTKYLVKYPLIKIAVPVYIYIIYSYHYWRWLGWIFYYDVLKFYQILVKYFHTVDSDK